MNSFSLLRWALSAFREMLFFAWTITILYVGEVNAQLPENLDFVVTDCLVYPAPGNTEVIFQFGLEMNYDAPLSASIAVPIDLYIDNELLERHDMAIVDVEGPACPPPAANACPVPATPCMTRNWNWQGKNLSGVANGLCKLEGTACVCKTPTVKHEKVTVRRPNGSVASGGPRTWEIRVDPDNAFAETNEANNSCSTDMIVPTVSEWGVAVMTLLLLTAATVVIRRRRAVTAGG